MDSVSHTKVARLLLAYIEETCGVTFDTAAFIYGNLKPDLTGTYLKKRHNPSVMYDEVMDMIRDFTEAHTIRTTNGHDLSVELGVLCHYITDFFTFPHNDDLYDRNLLAHYIYEKRTSLRISSRIDARKFERWAGPVIPPFTVEALIGRIGDMHARYREERHCISNDIVYICQITTMLVLSIINITYEYEPVAETPSAAFA